MWDALKDDLISYGVYNLYRIYFYERQHILNDLWQCETMTVRYYILVVMCSMFLCYQGIPQQNNHYDCGVFLLEVRIFIVTKVLTLSCCFLYIIQYTRCLLLDYPMNFTQVYCNCNSLSAVLPSVEHFLPCLIYTMCVLYLAT